MAINSKVKQLYDALKADGGDVGTPEEFNAWFFKPGKEGYQNRKNVYDTFKADDGDVGKNYEEFGQWLGLHAVKKPTPTVNKYRQQMQNAVDPNKNAASQLTKKAVATAKRATNTHRQPVKGAVVDKNGKKVGEFPITPAKTIEDLDREYAQEVTRDWENDMQRQSQDQVQLSLDEVQKKIAERSEALDESDSGFWTGIRHAAQGMNVTGGIFQPYDDEMRKELIDPKYKQYLVEANNLLQMKKQLIQEQEDATAPQDTKWDRFKHSTSSFVNGMVDGALQQDTFDFGGYNALRESDVLLRINERIKRGVATDDDRRLLQVLSDKQEVDSRLGNNNDAYYFGVGASQSIGFATDFLFTGGGDMGGLGRLGGKMALGVARNTFAKTMTKNLGKRFAVWSLKNLGKTAGEIAGASATTASVQIGKTAGNAVQRYLGMDSDDGGFEYDKDGKLQFKGGVTPETAIAKAFASGAIENYTELLGPHITSMGKRLWNWGGIALDKITPASVANFFSKVGSTELFKRLMTAADDIANSKVLNAGKKTLAKVGINDLPEEGLEEEAGIILNILITGDNKLSDLGDMETHLKTWGGVMSSIGSMRAMAIGWSASKKAVKTAWNKTANQVNYYSIKHSLNKADYNANAILGDKWKALKDKIDTTSNDDIHEVLLGILDSQYEGTLTREQTEAAVAYAGQLLKMRGFNNASMALVRDKMASGDATTEQEKKDKEVADAYAEGHNAEGNDTHDVMLDHDENAIKLANFLGITPEQLDAMDENALSEIVSQNGEYADVLQEYQVSKARRQGVIDNAQDAIDLAAQQAATKVDLYTDKKRNTVRNAMIQGINGEDDYGVYIVNGNIATHDDGVIDVGNSDDMILYYDPKKEGIQHADARRFASLGEEVPADEVKAQAIEDAKEAEYRKQVGIIDGLVEVGSTFQVLDEQGNEHTYNVVSDNGDGTFVVSVDGEVKQDFFPTLEQLQTFRDDADAKRLAAYKAQREQQKAEQAKTQQPVEDTFDYSKITDNQGNVTKVKVVDRNGKERYADRDVYLIDDSGKFDKIAFINEDGEIVPAISDKKRLKIIETKSLDEFKQERQARLAAEQGVNMQTTSDNVADTSNIEEDRGEIEAEETEPEPIGKGAFGNVYDQFKGKVKAAFEFLLKHKGGDLLGVFHRDDVGDIDLVWGDEKMGLAHIIGKHVGEGKDFGSVDDAINKIDEVIKNGAIIQDTENRYVINLDGFRVAIRKNFDGEDKKWIVTAVDYNRSKEEKGITTNPTSASHGASEPELAALNDSDGKGTNNSAENNENNETLTLEDGTVVPMMEDGNPDFSQLTAEQTAELYDSQFGEDAEQIISGFVSEAKKALDKATNMTVKGKNFAEQKASKAEKDKAVADAQTAYDSAKAISDAYAERQLSKETDTHEGRMNLIQKAKNKYSRLKNKDEWKNNPFALWNETVGKVLHRLYDGTSVDVFDHEPQTVEEYVSSNIAPYSLNFEGKENSKGVAAETGLQRKDFTKSRVLAAEGKGKTVDEFVHKLWDDRPKQLENVSDQEIRNALLSLITSDMNAYDMSHVIEDNRIAQAEEELENNKRAAENAAFEEEQRKAAEEEAKKKEEEAKKQAEAAAKAEEEEKNATTADETGKLDEEMADANDEYEHLAPSYNFENDENLSEEERENMVLREGDTFAEYRNRNGVDANGTTTPLGIKVARAYIQQKYGNKLADIDAIFGMPMKDHYDGWLMAEQMMKIVDADMNDFDAALMMRNDNVPLRSEAILGYLDGAAELIKARNDAEKLGLAAFDSEGNPVYKSIVELANWAKEQGLEVDGESAASNYANLYLACKDGFGATTLVPDQGDYINMVFYYPEQLKEENGEVNQERLSQMADEFNEGRDALHSAEADIELTDGAQFYNGDTAREFRDFVDKKTEEENKPFGEQIDESELPFSIKGKDSSDEDENKVLSPKERKKMVNNNSTTRKDVIDTVIGKDLRKSINAIAKKMGVNVQFLLSADQNGWFDRGTNTLYLALNTRQAMEMLFGHEMTHVIKSVNEAYYNEFRKIIRGAFPAEEYEKGKAKYREAYANVAGYNTDADYEEELIADEVGKLIHETNYAHTLAFKMSHPLLSIFHKGILDYIDSVNGTDYESPAITLLRSVEQAYLATAKGNFASSASGERFSLRDEEVAEANDRFNNEIEDFKNKSHKGLMHLGAPSPILRASGVNVDEITLSPKVLNKKLNQHSLTTDDVKDLVNAIQTPIMVYKHGKAKPNIVVITNAEIRGNKLSIALELDADGNVTELNNVSSIHDKDADKEVERLLDFTPEEFKEAMKWCDKEKVLDWISSARLFSHMQTENSQGLSLAKVINDFENPAIEGEDLTNNNENVKYSLRQKEEPKKKGIGYKVFLLGKDGKLYPPMVANPNGAATPVGVWLDADAAPIAGESKTGRPQVKQGGKGTQGGSGKLAYRPGWHLGVIPYALQFNRKDAEGNKTLFPKNFVFAEVEYAADVDYQQEAHDAGINPSGKYQHSLAGLKHLPTDGYYMYRTNPNPETDPWVITGAMKVNRILTRAEQAELVKKAGREPQMIQDGDIVTDEIVNSINQEIANAPKFSIKTYHGSQASFDHFDHSFMGSGEGAQAYGWGTYVSEVEGIARSYAKQNARKHKGSMELFDIESKLSHEEWDRAIMDTRYKNTLKDIEYQTKNRAKKQAMLDEELKDRPRLAQTYGENSDVVKDSDKIISQLQTIVNRAEQTLVELAERKKNIENDLANSDKKLADLKARLAAIPKPERNLYTVDIPDDNGDNYIDWDGSLSENAAANIAKGLVEKNIDAAIDMLYKYGNFIVKDDVNKLHDRKNEINKEKLAERIGKAISSYRGGAVYKDLAKVLGGQKNASLMLKDAGIDGVKVIAQRNTGGNKDGRMNYVIFDENNANIVNHEKFSLKNAKPVRFEVGKSLSEEEKKEVLATLKDAYKENNVSFHTEESANGKERRVYEPTADDYVKSDITGRALRYYITLPDGRIAHPTEVYPNISNNEVETSLKKRDVLGDEVKELIDGKVKKLKESASDIEKATAILTQLQDLEHETTDVGYGLDNPQSYNYKTGVFTSNANQAIDYVVRRMRRKEEVPADVVEAVKTAVKNSYGMVDNLLDGITSDSAPKTFEEFLESPSLKFQIRNEEQRKAAESAYNWAVENRPDKWKQYALVNMANPQQMPEYYEKKALADKWRRYENKVGVGARRVITDFKLFDLNKPFEENVVNVKGKVPEEFDPHKFEKNREEIAAINKQKKKLNEKLNALEEVRRKRMNDILKQYMDEHNLSSENEVPDDVWMGSRRTANDEYTAEADKVVEQIQELNKKLKSLSGNDVRFSLKDEKTLAGVHNITEEKLLKAIKMGGLANPSVAVIDFIKQKHEEYGDISLILPSDKVAKRTGKNAGTWQGDAWTPTYPQIERQMSNNGAEKASKDISSVPSDMYSEVRRGVDRWLDGGETNSAMAYMFLHEKGVAPEPKKIQHKFSDEAYKELKNITAGDFNIYGIGKADTKKVLDMYIEAKFDGDKSLYEEKTKAWLERNKSIVDAGTKGGMRYAIAKENVELYNKYGFNYKGVQTFVRDVEYDHRKTGVDTNATLNEVEDYIKTNNLTDEFNNWLEGKEKEYGIKEVIFDGFTPSGNRRYVPNTLENVSKIMKKQGRNGATGTAVSFQNFAARLMPSYGTLKDIRSRKDLLTSDREEFDKFREKWANVFYELGMKCQPDATGTFDDYGLARLSEAAMTSDPQAYLKKEYNVDFSDEDTKRLKEMVKAIKEEHPAMYFETKFERPVGFDEFSSAVVPTTASNEVKQALQNAGVQIYEYDKQKEGDRSRAFNEAINGSDNIRFSLRGSTSYDKQMEQWKKKNHLDADAKPMEKPIMADSESMPDYVKRLAEYNINQNLWKTAPKPTGFQEALEKWKEDNGLANSYPPVRPDIEDYANEEEYNKAVGEYKAEKKVWENAPKPKDFDLSLDLEDMTKQVRNIRRAVINQKNYDQRTVKAISDLVNKMLNIGWGDGLSRGKVGRLLSAAKNATGANDVKKHIDNVMNILADNYLGRLEQAYDNLINTKGVKADQNGVIKIGQLDPLGQSFIKEYKKAMNMDDATLDSYIADIEEDSAKNPDHQQANDYRLEGIKAAILYKQQIGGNDADIAEVENMIRMLKGKATKGDKELLAALRQKLFENKFDRIAMYSGLLANIQAMVSDSKSRVKDFKKEKEERKNDILHRANLDMLGEDSTYFDADSKKKKLTKNNPILRAIMSSTYTFEQFLKFFGKHHANGEGYLYNYFIPEWHDAVDENQMYDEMNRKALDAKAKELFGRNKFVSLVGIDGKNMKEMDCEVTDPSNKETGKRTIHLKQGQMLYIYLVNKETDGMMKLRAMGITEEDVEAIEKNLDPRVKAMGEWLQDEYLPQCQRRYQDTHTKYFGAPMKEVENYFPLAINSRARNIREDVNQDTEAMSQLAGTSTGAIVTRRVNVIPLDIENADAFAVAFNHLKEMEEWSAMLPFRQDINTLLSSTHFRNQVSNQESKAYGSGETVWNEFKQVAQIAAGTYKPKVGKYTMDGRIANALGAVSMAKISWRLWTGIKQTQSIIAFIPETGILPLIKNYSRLYGTLKWAYRNLPLFRKRVESLTSGDTRIQQFRDSLENAHGKLRKIADIGMYENIGFDALTCAVGARSVYEKELAHLIKIGYSQDQAEEKALLKASLAYNKTQQSSEGAFVSPMQVDRTYVSAALSLFKNANYAYGRKKIEAIRGIAKTYRFWGEHKNAMIESMKRQIIFEDGLDENVAEVIAQKAYTRTFWKNVGSLINYMTLMPISWALFKSIPYLAGGDDDDKKWKMVEEAIIRGFATTFTDDYVIPFASNALNAGLKIGEDGKPTFNFDNLKYQNLYINPATSDLSNIYSMIANQKWWSAGNKALMLGVQSLVGFNPETVGAVYQAISEFDDDNGNIGKERYLAFLKLISGPEESIREVYMDELGLKNDDVKKVALEELEQRYAERQMSRDNLLSQFGMDAETFNGYVEKYKKSFEKKIQAKMDQIDAYDQKKVDKLFDTISDPMLKDMIAKKRAKDAKAQTEETISKEGLEQEKKDEDAGDVAYRQMIYSSDLASDIAITERNKLLNKRYAEMETEYQEQPDAMKALFKINHPEFKAYKDLESEYTKYNKEVKELKEKLPSASGYDAKLAILNQIREKRKAFIEKQNKVN